MLVEEVILLSLKKKIDQLRKKEINFRVYDNRR